MNSRTILFSVLMYTAIFAQQKDSIDSTKETLIPFNQSKSWSGTQKDTLIYSSILGCGRNISIFTTLKHDSQPEKSPLIILFDRQYDPITNYILHSIDYMVLYGQIPRPVVIAINAGSGQRSKEAAWSTDNKDGLGEKLDDYIFDELIPYAEKNLHIDRNQIIIYGHSWFGYHSSMMLAKRIPQLFGVISASPGFLKNDRISDIIAGIRRDAPLLHHKFFFRVATGHDIGDDIQAYEDLTKSIEDLSWASNFDYKKERFSSGTHMAIPGLFFVRSLYEIYSTWAESAFKFCDPRVHNILRALDSLQGVSSAYYGFMIPFDDRHMEMKIDFYQYVKNIKIANPRRIDTWKLMISKYGSKADWLFNIADCYQQLGMKDSATVYVDKAKRVINNHQEWSGRIQKLEKRIDGLQSR